MQHKVVATEITALDTNKMLCEELTHNDRRKTISGA